MERTLASASPAWLSERTLLFNSIAGIIGLVLIFAELGGLFSFNRVVYPDHFRWLIANLLFLNTLHVPFTLVLIQESPLFSNRWSHINTKMKWFIPFLILLAIATVTVFMTESRFVVSAKIALLFGAIGPLFHSTAQYKGLCLNLIKDAKSRSLIKQLWNVGIVYVTVATVIKLWSIPEWLNATLIAGGFAIFLILLTLSLRAIGKTATSSWIPYFFHMKVLILPFVLVSFTALFIILCLHGIEYICVVSKQVNYRELKSSWGGRAVIASSFIFVFVITWVAACEFLWTSTGVLAEALLVSTAIIHYAVDGVLFRSPSFYSSHTPG